MPKTVRMVQAPSYAEALAEFPIEYRDLVDEFAIGAEGNWNRRWCVRFSPALALQLALNPDMQHARWLIDEHYPFDSAAEDAELSVPRQTRPVDLCVVKNKVHLRNSRAGETEVC